MRTAHAGWVRNMDLIMADLNGTPSMPMPHNFSPALENAFKNHDFAGLTDDDHDLAVELLLGRAPKQSEFPWLNGRQMRHRVYRETFLCEAISKAKGDDYDIAMSHQDLDTIIANSLLTKDQEQFWRLHFGGLSFNEIGDLERIHPKTVNRRVKEALLKIRTYLISEKTVP